jgi:sulfur transfer complex TusBCD TusB component (DsrH family)
MALHLLYNSNRYVTLLDTIKAEDVIIIFDQALLNWTEIQIGTGTPQCAAIFALTLECQQRELTLPIEGVVAISFADWIALTIKHPQQVNWI